MRFVEGECILQLCVMLYFRLAKVVVGPQDWVLRVEYNQVGA